MLQLKLKDFLRHHSLSESDLADAIADALIETGQTVSERHLRYVASNTDPITAENPKRKPSLVMLSLIIAGLRQLTGKNVTVQDVLEYVPHGAEAFAADAGPTVPGERGRNGGSGASNAGEARRSGNDLVLVVPQTNADDILDDVSARTVDRLRTKGFPGLSRLFQTAVGGGATAAPQSDRKRPRRLLRVGTLAGLLLTAFTLTYERLVVTPRLLAVRGDIFSSRDRVNDTSELAVPTLIGPEGGIEQLAPLLRASRVPGAMAYEFFVKNLVSDDYVYTGPIPNSTFPIPEGTLCPNTPYDWRVRALGHDGWTSFSSPLRFTVAPTALEASRRSLARLAQIKRYPPMPATVAPAGTTDTVTPTLELSPVRDVMGYGFYIRDLQTDEVIYTNHFAARNKVELPPGLLENGGVYQWNGRARNCHYWSDFTPAQVTVHDPDA